VQFGFLYFHRDLTQVPATCQLAEQLGFDLIGLVDSPTLAYDPYVGLTLAAQATEQVRIGPAVTNPQTRHPLILANLAASLEQLAPGRSYFGLGTGLSGVRHAGARAATVETMAQTVALVRGLLAGRAMESGGTQLALRVGGPRSVPILLAASGPRMLRLAGQIADLVLFNLGARPEDVRDALAWIAEGAESAGRDPASVESWLYTPSAIAPEAAQAREEVRNAAASSAVFTLSGDLSQKRVPEALREPIAELRRGYQFGEHLSPGRGSNYHLVERLGLTDYLLGRFSLAGSPEQCRQQIAELRRAGLDNICFNLGAAADLPASLRLFGEQVLPAFR
jgi:5,10-methylenetetrahydromethanopterin reductase